MHIVQRHPLDGVRVDFVSYPIKEIQDEVSFPKLYQQIHFEWFYSIMNNLPTEVQSMAGEWFLDRWIDQTVMR
jgi:hypothetical protein